MLITDWTRQIPLLQFDRVCSIYKSSLQTQVSMAIPHIRSSSGCAMQLQQAHPLEASLEGIKLRADGVVQKMLHVQIHIQLFVVICDRLAATFRQQIHCLGALTKVTFLLSL